MNQATPKNETPPLSVQPIRRTGIPGFAGVLLYILIALSALMIPLGVTVLLGTSFLPDLAAEGLSLIFLLALAFYFACTAKQAGRISRGITPLMIAASIITYYLFGSLVPIVPVIALIFAAGEGAVLLATGTKLQLLLFPLSPLAALAASVVLVGRVDMALLSLIPFPVALVLAMGTRSCANREQGLTRVGVICATSLTLGLSVAAFALWFAYDVFGTLSPSVLMEKVNDFRQYLVNTLVTMEFSYGGTVTVPLAGKEVEVANIVNGMINTLPGTLVTTVNVMAACAQMITLSGLQAYGYGASLSPRVRAFRISAVSSAIFLIAWIVALVAVGDNSSSTLVGTVAENLFTVLVPGLALAGVLHFMRFMAQRGARPGCGLFLLLIIPCMIAYIPTVIATVEALVVVFGPLLAKTKAAKAKDEPSPDRERPRRTARPMTDEERFEQYCREQEARRRGTDDPSDDLSDDPSDDSSDNPSDDNL